VEGSNALHDEPGSDPSESRQHCLARQGCILTEAEHLIEHEQVKHSFAVGRRSVMRRAEWRMVVQAKVGRLEEDDMDGHTTHYRGGRSA
jgi:hypothetical protein